MSEAAAPLRHDAGGLYLGASRYLLIRPETLAALQRSLEARLGADAAEHLAAAGRAGGRAALAALDVSPADAVGRLLAMGTAIGWGEFFLERLDPRSFVVSVRHSPFAEALGPAAGPACHLTRGVLERLAEAVLGASARVVETACAAAGAPACRFEATA